MEGSRGAVTSDREHGRRHALMQPPREAGRERWSRTLPCPGWWAWSSCARPGHDHWVHEARARETLRWGRPPGSQAVVTEGEDTPQGSRAMVTKERRLDLGRRLLEKI